MGEVGDREARPQPFLMTAEEASLLRRGGREPKLTERLLKFEVDCAAGVLFPHPPDPQRDENDAWVLNTAAKWIDDHNAVTNSPLGRELAESLRAWAGSLSQQEPHKP